jgi:hypothetical protein
MKRYPATTVSGREYIQSDRSDVSLSRYGPKPVEEQVHYAAILLLQRSAQFELEAGVDCGEYASDLAGKDG